MEGANRVETRKQEGKTPEQERLLRRFPPVVGHFELTVPKAGGLAGGGQDGVPQEAIGGQALLFSGQEFDGHENAFIVQQPKSALRSCRPLPRERRGARRGRRGWRPRRRLARCGLS